MSRYLQRIDANQNEIVEALRKAGASVYSLASVGHGVPDLLVGFRGQTFLLEVKTRKGRLTHAQKQFHATWDGHIAVVRSVEDALFVIGLLTMIRRE